MTLVEFLAPLKNSTTKNRVLAVLYFKQRYEDADSLTTEEIRTALKSARVPKANKINVADVLAKCGPNVHSPGSKGNRLLWGLTDTGANYVRDLLGLPATEAEIEHDVSSLSAVLPSISNRVVRDYVQEGIRCLQIGAKRAAVVFLWAGGIRTLQERMLKRNTQSLNAALQKHDSRARRVSKIDHFSYIKDRITLLAAQELDILDKSEKDTLQEALSLRNRCGHPAKYSPGEKKVSSFIEDMTQVVFS